MNKGEGVRRKDDELCPGRPSRKAECENWKARDNKLQNFTKSLATKDLKHWKSSTRYCQSYPALVASISKELSFANHRYKSHTVA